MDAIFEYILSIEGFFTILLVLVSVVIVWFAGYVVYKLYKGQA